MLLRESAEYITLPTPFLGYFLLKAVLIIIYTCSITSMARGREGYIWLYTSERDRVTERNEALEIPYTQLPSWKKAVIQPPGSLEHSLTPNTHAHTHTRTHTHTQNVTSNRLRLFYDEITSKLLRFTEGYHSLRYFTKFYTVSRVLTSVRKCGRSGKKDDEKEEVVAKEREKWCSDCYHADLCWCGRECGRSAPRFAPNSTVSREFYGIRELWRFV